RPPASPRAGPRRRQPRPRPRRGAPSRRRGSRRTCRRRGTVSPARRARASCPRPGAGRRDRGSRRSAPTPWCGTRTGARRRAAELRRLPTVEPRAAIVGGALQSWAVRAVVCQQLGPLDDLVVEDRQPLAPGPDEAVIDVRAAGVNYVDGLICQGRYQIKPPTPFVPGSEIAGEVTAVGAAVKDVRTGDRVIAMTGFGGFADEVAVPAASVVPIPAALTFGQAAA